MGKVPQKIAGCSNAESIKRLGPTLPDTLQELDRSVESDRCRSRPGGHSPLRCLDRRFGEQILGEPLGIEWFQIVQRFAQPDESDWQAELPAEGRDGPTAGTAVQLGYHNAGRMDGLSKELPLLNGVLSDRTIEDEQGLMRRAGEPSADHPVDLSKLIHETLLRVQSSRGVDDDRIQT